MAQDNGAPDARLTNPSAGPVGMPEPSYVAPRNDTPWPADMPTAEPFGSTDSLPLRTRLSERIVALPPPKSIEAFRTKVKVKAPAAPATATIPDGTVPLGDDLTRIRGIDATLANRLRAFGVSGFAQIAAWDQTDVKNVSQVLDLGRTISRQNWIEQAAMLKLHALALVTPHAAPPTSKPVVPIGAMELTQLGVSEREPIPAETAAAPPQSTHLLAEPTLTLPRVVSVDSPGDAKFHQAVVYVLPSVEVAASAHPAVSAGQQLWTPRVPVPEVLALALSATAPTVARRELVMPVQIPVPVVPLPLEQPSDMTPSLQATQPIVVVNSAEVADLIGDTDISGADDDTLATQLHAAVAAAADDRAVAATLDLLSAFSPPPVADLPDARDPYGWPPTLGTVAAPHPAADPEAIPDVVGAADVTFTRWVPPMPLRVPPPPRASVRATDAYLPTPWAAAGALAKSSAATETRWVAPEPTPMPAMLRPATWAVAASAAAGHATAHQAQSTTDAPSWSQPRDRWDAVDYVIAEPTPRTEQAADPVPVPYAPLEPVVPTMLDRLASLEAELAALATTDQPRAHLAHTPAVALAASPALNPRFVPALPPHHRALASAPAPDLTRDYSRSTGRRAGVRPEPTDAAKALPAAPLTARNGFGGEADVTIRPRCVEQLEIRPLASGPSIGTVEQRLRRARPAPEVDVETYAGYHAAISEASVEIVRRDTHTRAMVFSDSGDPAAEATARGRDGAVRKFFKALKGNAN